ncbi:unnamed protein product, partial [Chrysoparadoxa australica]
LLFGLASIPLGYLYSNSCESHLNAQIVISGLHFITGYGFVLAHFVLAGIEKTQDLAASLLPFFRVFPPFNLGEGLVNLSIHFSEREFLGVDVGVLSWEVTGRNIFLLLAEAAAFFMLTISIETLASFSLRSKLSQACVSWLPSRRRGTHHSSQATQDEGVAGEAEYVTSMAAQDCPILIQDLGMVYPAPLCSCGVEETHALRGVSLAIRQGEVFGLLGENGAGKSSLLSLLTSQCKPSSGVVYIEGQDVTSLKLRGRRPHLALCPQTDPLLPLMTGRETLRMYATLKGIPKDQSDQVVSSLLTEVGLDEYRDKVCGAYSGGNKRKLSLAIALVANPAILLLDEPSCGIDVGAQRAVHQLIFRVSRLRSVILTTHSMKECEALSDRIGIMCKGRLQALGSPQQLKSRFSEGLLIEAHCRMDSMDKVEELMAGLSPLVTVEERHLTRIRFAVPRNAGVSLGGIFELIEEHKETVGISEYSVSQGSLEQAFLQVVRSDAARQEGPI